MPLYRPLHFLRHRSRWVCFAPVVRFRTNSVPVPHRGVSNSLSHLRFFYRHSKLIIGLLVDTAFGFRSIYLSHIFLLYKVCTK